MKKLIISIKSPGELLNEVQSRLGKAANPKAKVTPHYEISFTDMKQFKKFISNIDILTHIQLAKPKSIYELASYMNKDAANINRIINFFEEIGALRLEEQVVRGRKVKTPVVDYQKIEFDLVA